MANPSCVFVVDDDPSASRGLVRLLRAAGHDVREFASDEGFLGALEPEVSGCAVLDPSALRRSGAELRAELEARGARLSIIVVTTEDDAGTRQEAEEVKAVVFFRKPVDGTALLDAVSWALQSKSHDEKGELGV